MEQAHLEYAVRQLCFLGARSQHTSAYVSIRQHTRDLEDAARQLCFLEELAIS